MIIIKQFNDNNNNENNNNNNNNDNSDNYNNSNGRNRSTRCEPTPVTKTRLTCQLRGSNPRAAVAKSER